MIEPDTSTPAPGGGTGPSAEEGRLPSRTGTLRLAALMALAAAALAVTVGLALRDGNPASSVIAQSPATVSSPGQANGQGGAPGQADGPSGSQAGQEAGAETRSVPEEASEPAAAAPCQIGPDRQGGSQATARTRGTGRGGDRSSAAVSAQAQVPVQPQDRSTGQDSGRFDYLYDAPDLPPRIIKIWQSNYRLDDDPTRPVMRFEFTLDTRGSSVGRLENILIDTNFGDIAVDGYMDSSEECGFRTAWLETSEPRIEYFEIEGATATLRGELGQDIMDYLYLQEDIQPRPIIFSTDSPDMINAIKKFEIPKFLKDAPVYFGEQNGSLPERYFSDFVDAAVREYERQNTRLLLFHGAGLINRPVEGPYISLFFNVEGIVGFSVMTPGGGDIDSDSSDFTFSCKVVVDKQEVLEGDDDEDGDGEPDGVDESGVPFRRVATCIDPEVGVPRDVAERLNVDMGPVEPDNPNALVVLDMATALKRHPIMRASFE